MSIAPIDAAQRGVQCSVDEGWALAARRIFTALELPLQPSDARTLPPTLTVDSTAAGSGGGSRDPSFVLGCSDPCPAPTAGVSVDRRSDTTTEEAAAKAAAIADLTACLFPAGQQAVAEALGHHLLDCGDQRSKVSGAAWLSAAAAGSRGGILVNAASALDDVGRPSAAAALWRTACDYDKPTAEILWQAGQAMLLGEGGQPDFKTGMTHIQQACEQGQPGARFALRGLPVGGEADPEASDSAPKQDVWRVAQRLQQAISNGNKEFRIRGTMTMWADALAGSGEPQHLRSAAQLHESARAHGRQNEQWHDQQRCKWYVQGALKDDPACMRWIGANVADEVVQTALGMEFTEGEQPKKNELLAKCFKASMKAVEDGGVGTHDDHACGTFLHKIISSSSAAADARAAFVLARSLAEGGSPSAQAQHAHMLEHGIGCEADVFAAFRESVAAAAAGSAEEGVRLAGWRAAAPVAYAQGRTLEEDGHAAQAMRMYRWAAAAGDPCGVVALARMLQQGVDAPPNVAAADALLSTVAEEADIEKLYQLSVEYVRCAGADVHPSTCEVALPAWGAVPDRSNSMLSTALRLGLKAAGTDHVSAQMLVASMYLQPEQPIPHISIASRHFNIQVQQLMSSSPASSTTSSSPASSTTSSSPALDATSPHEADQYMDDFEIASWSACVESFLSNVHEPPEASAVVREKEAFYWYQQAARGGNAYAKYKAGALHECQSTDGDCFAASDYSQLDWYRLAAEAGCLEAMVAYADVKLASTAYSSDGSDVREIKQWLDEAVAANFAPALAVVGEMMTRGNLYEQDLAAGVQLLCRAADLGHCEAKLKIEPIQAVFIGRIESARRAQRG